MAKGGGGVHDGKQSHEQPGRRKAKHRRGGGRHRTGQRVRPTGSLGAEEKRREASKRVRELPGSIAPGNGVEQGLHTSTTTYLALAAVTSMPSMLAVVVKRAGRAVSCGRERQEKERACVEDDDHDEKDWPAGQNKANQSKQH